MTDNAVELADEAVACRLIADAFYARAKELSTKAAESMGRGTLYPKLADGTELACFNVPADAATVEVDADLLLPWVRENYPDNVMQAVRPAFVELIRRSSKEAGQTCGPGGEVDIPGVTYYLKPGSPRITPKDAGRERAQAAVSLVVAQAFERFAHLEIEGGRDAAQAVHEADLPQSVGSGTGAATDAKGPHRDPRVPVRQAQADDVAPDQQATIGGAQ